MEQLIDLLDENSCLWDVSNEDYYLKKKRERAYKQRETRFGTESAAIKAKITTLRQQCWQLLRSFACTTQQVPTTPNIVGPNNVVTCCVRLHEPLWFVFETISQKSALDPGSGVFLSHIGHVG